MRIGLIFLFLSIFLLLPLEVAATSIRDIDVRGKMPIKEGRNFKVEAELRGDTCDVKVQFYIDDKRFASKTPGCMGDEEEKIVEAEYDWEENGALKCGDHELRVELIDKLTDESLDNKSMTIQIGNFPEILFSPEKPKVGETLTLTFLDEGEPKSGIRFDLFYGYGNLIKSKRHSNVEGKFSFVPEKSGRYEIRMRDSTYCGSKVFYVKHEIVTDGPYPATPMVGEVIHLAYPKGVGAKVVDDEGKVYKTLKTFLSGGTNFTIEEPGNYTIVLGEGSTRFWSKNISLTVVGEVACKLHITPEKPVVGKPIILKVECEGEPLEDATITITQPDGGFKTFTTSPTGEVEYNQANFAGQYAVHVEKERYQTIDSGFEARNNFSLLVHPEIPKVGDNLTIVVKDQHGFPQVGVLVKEEGGELLETNADGVVTIPVTKLGEMKLKFQKAEFWDSELSVFSRGVLTVNLSTTSVEVGNSVEINLNTPATFVIRSPSGIEEKESGQYYTFTPSEVGIYNITFSKEGYLPQSVAVISFPHPLQVRTKPKGKNLVIEILSHGRVVPNISVSVETPSLEKFELKSNEDGVVSVPIETGIYSIVVNAGNATPLYEVKTLTPKISKHYHTWLLILSIGIILAVATIIIAFVTVLHKPIKPKKKSLPSKKKSLLSPSKKSRLSKL